MPVYQDCDQTPKSAYSSSNWGLSSIKASSNGDKISLKSSDCDGSVPDLSSEESKRPFSSRISARHSRINQDSSSDLSRLLEQRYMRAESDRIKQIYGSGLIGADLAQL